VLGWSYDAAGNLLSDAQASSQYDALNRLITTTAGIQSRAYGYNGMGTLITETVNGLTTRYAQDLVAPLSQVLSSSGGLTATHLYGRERLASVEGSNRTWYVPDALGSVRVTLNTAGDVLTTHRYDPYGTPQLGDVPRTFGFTGEPHDTTVGLVNLRARWYATAEGRLLTRDPFMGFAQRPYSQHPYAYALSNPSNFTDPSGKLTIFFQGGWNDPADETAISRMQREFQGEGLLPEGKAVTLAANDILHGARLIEEIALEQCPPEPIIIIGYSRGGAAAQQLAAYILMQQIVQPARVSINLIVTVGPVEAAHPRYTSIPRHKLSNVREHINFLSEQKTAAVPTDESLWPDRIPGTREFEIDGAENIVIPETSHFSVIEQPMSLYKMMADKPKLPLGLPQSKRKYGEIFPSPVWQLIRAKIIQNRN
jgi:RHS repeat-associated protein